LRAGAGLIARPQPGQPDRKHCVNNRRWCSKAGGGPPTTLEISQSVTYSSENPNSKAMVAVLGAAKEMARCLRYRFRLGIQHETVGGHLGEIPGLAYVGSMSRHLVTRVDIIIPYGYAFSLAAPDPNACGWNGTVGQLHIFAEYAADGSVSAESARWEGLYINTPVCL